MIETTGLKEGDFIVLMITSGKPKPVPAAPAAQPTTATTAPSASTNVPTTSVSSESTLVTGAAYEDAVSRITEMGFSRDAAIKALRASFNNPDRAVEYLTSGFALPDEDMVGEEGEGDEESGEEGVELMNAILGEGGQEGGASSALEFLREDPQFQQLRAVIQANPQLLGPILEQLAQSSPELFGLIHQHEEEFIALMNEGPDGQPLPDLDDAGAGGESRIIQLSEEELAAVERLTALSFDKARAVEAYFACDKNEELAANFLLEHLGDDDF